MNSEYGGEKEGSRGKKIKYYWGMVHATAASFLIIRPEPAGDAVFAMLRCGGGRHPAAAAVTPRETRLNAPPSQRAPPNQKK